MISNDCRATMSFDKDLGVNKVIKMYQSGLKWDHNLILRIRCGQSDSRESNHKIQDHDIVQNQSIFSNSNKGTSKKGTKEMGWASDLTVMGRECIAELIGTLILCAFGNASLAVFILEPKMSSSLSVHFSWGMGKSIFLQKSGPKSRSFQGATVN